MTGKDPHVIGTRIAKRRHQLGWSQVELARRLGVSPSSVANWERGASYPKKKLGKVEQVLGILLLDEAGPAPPAVPRELEAYPDLVEDVRRRYPHPDDHMPMLEAIAATLRGESPPTEPGAGAADRSDARRAG